MTRSPFVEKAGSRTRPTAGRTRPAHPERPGTRGVHRHGHPKLAVPLSADATSRAVDALCELQVETLDSGLMRAAVRRSRVSRLSYWDSLIVETALSAGADVLFTEDLQDGQAIDGLRVVNPFRDNRGP